MATSAQHTNEDAPRNASNVRDPFAPDEAVRNITDMGRDVVAFEGYLGEGPDEQRRRLYQDPRGKLWITVRIDDIDERISRAGDDLTADSSVIWVRRNAKIVRCEAGRASDYEAPAASAASGDSGAYSWPRRP